MDSAVQPASAGETLGGFEVEVTAERVRAYADAASDHNPIHLDAAFAATTPFGGTIAHGMLLLAYLTRPLSERFGAAWLLGGTVNARFRQPARVGTRVHAGGVVRSVVSRDDVTVVECDLQVTDDDGHALVTATVQVVL
jgi:3-hydroxybutyryl-CoA dehydratase